MLDSLKKRKIITPHITRYFGIAKAAEFKPIYVELESDLTADMIKNFEELTKNDDGSVKTDEELAKSFKKYNWNADGKEM